VFDRLILMTTSEEDLVFDPMAGSGTTAVCAKRLGRKAIDCDMSEEYTAMMERRLKISRLP